MLPSPSSSSLQPIYTQYIQQLYLHSHTYTYTSMSPLFLSILLLLLSSLPSSLSSLSFPLISAVHHRRLQPNKPGPFDFTFTSKFKYSTALIVSLPVGTPPQSQQMVLDTGSQLSWIQCSNTTSSFDPTRSSSFSTLPCNHPLCKPRIPDFSLPTDCDSNRLCHYSYFYADGTLAQGNLVTEKFTLHNSKSTPPLILGCAANSDSSQAQGILGLNLGRLSFVSQAKVPKFSYCVPSVGEGKFYLGENPNSRNFKYTKIQTFPESRGKPNFDPNAYTVGLIGIKIGGKRLNISESVFRPDSGGSGQTIIDSGTQYTFLVDAAYDKVKDEIVRRTGGRMKKGYVYGGALEMCFNGGREDVGGMIGEMVLDFGNGVEMVIGKERVLDKMEGGIWCVGIGRSGSLGGVASNIIGNFHQQEHWVEVDVVGRRVGFGVADCSKV